ncbi:MAG: bifunctional alpha,alpha-trehalose-phosphate synthase (UDP-forming)/trehalose-phosphatase [Vicinamibacterales bacterium]
MPTGRLLIVSNRLPVTARVHDGAVTLVRSAGGLATGLGPWHESSGGLWIGWPGETPALDAAGRADLEQQLETHGIVPVHLSSEQVERHYNGFSNRVLWPFCHYLIDRVPLDATGWGAYRQVNEAFADVVAYHYRTGDTIWVHDYQLMLLPMLLRERLPLARIGYFLHVPFPSSEVFRILPWRREVLRGLLGADLIGFHTFAYLRHFVSSLLHVEGVEADIDRVKVEGRLARLGVFPMGVDAPAFDARAATPEVEARAEALRRDAGGRRIVLGVDRLDYTKGIPRRLVAVARALERHPELRDGMRYIQVAVPSRGGVDQYRRFRTQVEENVGRINGQYGTLRSAPVHYVHQSVSPVELSALYRAADVMLVTPLRDGMNLVAKEFVASRRDLDGVLVLSEFAGAASELDGAAIVNPYDVEHVATTLVKALGMPDGERRSRMQRLRQRVFAYDVHVWAKEFLQALGGTAAAETIEARPPAPRLASVVSDLATRRRLRLLLDYDGTLVPFARSPGLAAPDAELKTLLRALSERPGTLVEIVSGRPKDTLEAWLGDLPVALWAEHGFGIARRSRPPGPRPPRWSRRGSKRVAPSSRSSPRPPREPSWSGRPRRLPGTIAAPTGISAPARPTSCGCCSATRSATSRSRCWRATRSSRCASAASARRSWPGGSGTGPPATPRRLPSATTAPTTTCSAPCRRRS